MIAAAPYALAKLMEFLDEKIYSLGSIVSGHTLKQLAAAAASLAILRLLQIRRPIAPWFLGWSGRSDIWRIRLLGAWALIGAFAAKHATEGASPHFLSGAAASAGRRHDVPSVTSDVPSATSKPNDDHAKIAA
jgi:hypothetical protein